MTTTIIDCSKYGHPEFRISCDESIPRDDVEWLASILERSVRDGARYQEGELIDLGSMLLRVGRGRGGTFVIEEPDFREVPISWTIGVTLSLRLLRLQKDVAESIRLAGNADCPPLRHSLLVGTDLDPPIEQFVMERAAPSDADSGWFIGRLHSTLDYNDPSNLSRMSVYAAVVTWPQLAGLLALPSGIRVAWSDGTISLFFQDQPLQPTEGSLLGERR